MTRRFWVWLCRFAFRRAFRPGKIPAGLPGHRDPDHVCASYWPIKKPSGHGQCQTDGHYLCAGCEWVDPQSEAMEGLCQIK